MSTTYRIDTKRRLVIARAAGRVSEADLIDYQESLRSDPRFRPDFDQILDLRGCTELRVTTAGVCHAALQSPFGATSRRAVLGEDEVLRELARVYGLWSDGLVVRTRFFHRVEHALVWLGLPDFQPTEAKAPWYPVLQLRAGTSAAG
jgi:hypothetical protein